MKNDTKEEFVSPWYESFSHFFCEFSLQTRTATMYENGQFKEIADPLSQIVGNTHEEWHRELARLGYCQTDGDKRGRLEIYTTYNPRDREGGLDYPYFVILNVCGVGKVVFFEKWYYMTDFINKHCAIGQIENEFPSIAARYRSNRWNKTRGDIKRLS